MQDKFIQLPTTIRRNLLVQATRVAINTIKTLFKSLITSPNFSAHSSSPRASCAGRPSTLAPLSGQSTYRWTQGLTPLTSQPLKGPPLTATSLFYFSCRFSFILAPGIFASPWQGKDTFDAFLLDTTDTIFLFELLVSAQRLASSSPSPAPSNQINTNKGFNPPLRTPCLSCGMLES